MPSAEEPDRRVRELSDDELRAQQGEPLPNREAMSTLNPAVQPLPPVLADDPLIPTDTLPK